MRCENCKIQLATTHIATQDKRDAWVCATCAGGFFYPETPWYTIEHDEVAMQAQIAIDYIQDVERWIKQKKGIVDKERTFQASRLESAISAIKIIVGGQ